MTNYEVLLNTLSVSQNFKKSINLKKIKKAYCCGLNESE